MSVTPYKDLYSFLWELANRSVNPQDYNTPPESITSSEITSFQDAPEDTLLLVMSGQLTCHPVSVKAGYGNYVENLLPGTLGIKLSEGAKHKLFRKTSQLREASGEEGLLYLDTAFTVRDTRVVSDVVNTDHFYMTTYAKELGQGVKVVPISDVRVKGKPLLNYKSLIRVSGKVGVLSLLDFDVYCIDTRRYKEDIRYILQLRNWKLKVTMQIWDKDLDEYVDRGYHEITDYGEEEFMISTSHISLSSMNAIEWSETSQYKGDVSSRIEKLQNDNPELDVNFYTELYKKVPTEVITNGPVGVKPIAIYLLELIGEVNFVNLAKKFVKHDLEPVEIKSYLPSKLISLEQLQKIRKFSPLQSSIFKSN